MKRFLFIFFFFLISVSLISGKVLAADIRNEEHVVLSQNENLSNTYALGDEVTSNASISGDLVVAGGNVTIHGITKGSVMAAGGDVVIDGEVGNSIRAAGGNITISAPVTNDVLVTGGTVKIDKTATIGGDLIFFGGTLQVNGPIKGNLIVHGGNIVLSNTVGGDVNGNVTTLQLKDETEVGGDLNYTSSRKALVSDGAIIHGQEIYHSAPKKEDSNGLGEFLATGAILKLITDILFALLLVYLFPSIIKSIGAAALSKPLKNSLWGIGFLLFVPLIASISLLIIWLGISLWLLYFVFLILALVIGKILFGWWVLKWWSERSKRTYTLDWKASVIGPLLLALLFFIPIIGWLTIAAIYLISLGSLFQTSLELGRIKK